jgi:hypothetical protein
MCHSPFSRQSINYVRSVCYSVRASVPPIRLRFSKLGGIAAAQYVQTGDARMSDSRSPLPIVLTIFKTELACREPQTSISRAQAANSFNSGTHTAAGNASSRLMRAAYISRIQHPFANGGSNNTFAGNRQATPIHQVSQIPFSGECYLQRGRSSKFFFRASWFLKHVG